LYADRSSKDEQLIRIRTAQRNPTYWFRYVDNIFVACPGGKDEVEKCLLFFSNINKNIKFTTAIENNSSLPFVAVLENRQPDGALGHAV
jgi:hypothetical protein